jgi:hypothetical protein
MKSAFDKIAAGINDVTAFARGDTSRATIHKFGNLTIVNRPDGVSTREAMAEARRSLRQLWNETIKEPLPPDIIKLLDELQ